MQLLGRHAQPQLGARTCQSWELPAPKRRRPAAKLQKLRAGDSDVRIGGLDLPLHQLQGRLDAAVAKEDYEAASKLRDELQKRQEQGDARGRVAATNIFEKQDGQWRLIHHHGSEVPRL
ncbi:hypothetical protein WJX73_002505 [Symbiochloris irregularis]|uniref:UVR domain-containing protein n=1 Tax=Symbiochloris irregularis TaxID=706552 RepID=A0AAW1NYA5_9CHLO